MDILVKEACIARDNGDFVRAAVLAAQELPNVANIFGKYSYQAMSIPFFIAECYFCHSQTDVTQDIREQSLSLAIGNCGVLTTVLEEQKQEDSVLYLRSNLLFGRIIIADKDNSLPATNNWGEDVSREMALNVARNALFKTFKRALTMLETSAYSEKTQQEIAEIGEALRAELVVILPDNMQPERRQVKELCHYVPEVGWLSEYRDLKTGESFFNGEQICKHFGITQKEAEKYIGKSEIVFLDDFDIIDE